MTANPPKVASGSFRGRSTALFDLGQVVATPAALEALKDAKQSGIEFLSRHVSGDWGEVCKTDWKLNDQDLKDGNRLLSAYRTKKNVKLWIITEWNRSVTTILLPEDY